jgi:hypothetical protein
MLDLYALYASGLALVRVTLLKTCGSWTSGDLLLDLLLLQNEPTDVGSGMALTLGLTGKEEVT